MKQTTCRMHQPNGTGVRGVPYEKAASTHLLHGFGATLFLLIDPSSALEAGPVLRREVSALVVNDVIVHQFTDFGKIEERDHGVTVMLIAKVGADNLLKKK